MVFSTGSPKGGEPRKLKVSLEGESTMARRNSNEPTLAEIMAQVEKAAEFDAAADIWTLKAAIGVGNLTVHTGRFTGVAALIDHHQKALDKGNAAAARRFGRALELLNVGLFHDCIAIEKGKRTIKIIYQYTVSIRDIADRDQAINGLPQDKAERKEARSILTENWRAFCQFLGEDLWNIPNVQIKYSKRTRSLDERGRDLAKQLEKYMELANLDLREFADAFGLDIPEIEEEKAAA